MKKSIFLFFIFLISLLSIDAYLFGKDERVKTLLVVSEQNTEPRLSVYPNPASQQTTIQIKEENLQIKQVVVYNILGKQVLQKNFSPNKKVILNVGGLKNGQYILWVILSNQESETTTLIKI